jgi:L-2-hydroxyglutarate oxidase LhgO
LEGPSVVLGAGVVGLALAARLARSGRDVLILEREDRFGTGASSRNSEVIHSGTYGVPGTLKARLCVEGRGLLYRYCEEHGVAHRRCGKLIVATDPSQMEVLVHLERQGRTNGVTDLRFLDAAEARELEPALRCERALLSPSTGIVDSHGLMRTLLAEAEAAGATFLPRSPVLGGEPRNGGLLLDVGGDEPSTLEAGEVFNCAGLGAVAVAASIRGIRGVPRGFMAKGNYFALAGRPPFSRLVYPVPEAAGLGVHLTLDLAGQARFGPDVEWVAEEGYDVDPRRADGFQEAIRRYWPGLPDDALCPAYAGIRAKLQAPGGVAMDFLVQGPPAHGVPGLVNLLGIESPGLTSCLALAALAEEAL